MKHLLFYHDHHHQFQHLLQHQFMLQQFHQPFFGVIQEPITTRFSPQSKEAEKTIHEDETNDENVMVSFIELQFNNEVEGIHEDLIMSGKQLKILQFNNEFDSSIFS